MWLSGQHKQPAECGEGQIGVVTVSGEENAVLLDCERRGLPIYSPGGYSWTPTVNGKVLVIQGRGEIPCIVGAPQGGETPDEVSVRANSLALEGKQAEIAAKDLDLKAQVYIKGERLEDFIIRIVSAI